MGKLQSFKRIIAEDFEAKDNDLVSKIGFSVNTFAEDVLDTLNKKISIDDNLDIIKKDITLTVDGSGNVKGSGYLKTGLNHICQGIAVIRATNITSPTTYPTGTPWVSFTEDAGVIKIKNVSNLQADNKYTLKLLLF